MAATTPMGSRMIVEPPIEAGPAVGWVISIQSKRFTTRSALERNIGVEPAA